MNQPTKIDQYEIKEMIGSGAMGDVYSAIDRGVANRTVALKVLSDRLSRNEMARKRFEREVETSANLAHQNIVTIHAHGEWSGRPYFVMEFLDGYELTQITSGAIEKDLTSLLEIARQITDALDYAHGCGVVHRDIKPRNIMVMRRGEKEIAKLLDFGIVQKGQSTLTQASTQPGTFSYMPPEQLNGSKVDGRSDLFAFGIVLYEMFTRVHPFQAATDPLIMGKILNEVPKRPRHCNPEIPWALDSIILKLLEKDVEQRPPRAREVEEVLHRISLAQQSKTLGTDPSDFEALSDLDRQTVENYVQWARKKESDGEVAEALGAYHKVASFAPDNERLQRKIRELEHRVESAREMKDLLQSVRYQVDEGDLEQAREAWRKAWILNPNHEDVEALRIKIDEAERQSPPEVQECISKAREFIDEGDFGKARHVLTDALRKHPDEASLRNLIDRCIAIQTSGIEYRSYRQELKTAQRRLLGGEFGEAKAAVERAKNIWPTDEEWADADAQIESRRETEIAQSITNAEEGLQKADAGDEEGQSALDRVEEVERTLNRAVSLGANPKYTQPLQDRAKQLRDDLRGRLEAKRRASDAERQRDLQKTESNLTRARAKLREAETVVRERSGDLASAVLLVEQAVEILSGTGAGQPGHEASAELVQARERLQALRVEVDRRSELTAKVEAAKRVWNAATAPADADPSRLGQCLERLEDVQVVLEGVLRQDPQHDEALAALQENKVRTQELRNRLDDRLQRGAAVDSAVQEARRALVEAERPHPGDLTSLRAREAEAGKAERAFRDVLNLRPEHEEAVAGLSQAGAILSRIRAEIEVARTPGPETGATEAAAPPATSPKPAADRPAAAGGTVREDEERIQRAQDLYEKATGLRRDFAREADRIHEVLGEALGVLDELSSSARREAAARQLRSRVERLREKAEPKIAHAVALRKFDEELNRAEQLVDSGQTQEARKLLLELKAQCDRSPQLRDDQDFVADLLKKTKGGSRWPIWAGAAAVVVVVAVVLVVVLGPDDAGKIDGGEAGDENVSEQAGGEEEAQDAPEVVIEETELLWREYSEAPADSVLDTPGWSGTGFSGTLTAAETGEALSGYRVVLKDEGHSRWFRSTPADGDGDYQAALPPGRYQVVALESPAGDPVKLAHIAPPFRLGENQTVEFDHRN